MWVRRYDEIRSMQVIHLLSVFLSGGEEESKTLHKKLDKKISSYAAGELEHAAEAIISIYILPRKDEPLPSFPRNEPCAPAPQGWNARTPLIESIQGGSLLHRKYWARRSRRGSISPIYFPNVVSNSTFSEVDACEWGYTLWFTNILSRTVVECSEWGDGHPENEEYEFPEDSDCESECEADGDPVAESSGVGCERGNELLPVLKVGSLNA